MINESVLIVIFTLNESENIIRLLEEISLYALDKDILVIDDRSDDGTIEAVKKTQSKNNKIKLIQRTGPRGRGLSELDAIAYVKNNEYEFMLEMDADFSHDPQDIPLLLNCEDADIIIGSRYVSGGIIEGRSWHRNLLSRLSKLYAEKVLSLKNIKDPTSGFRLYRTCIFDDIDINMLKTTGPAVILGLLYSLRNKNIKEVPIVFRDRLKDKSKFNFKILFEAILYCLKIRIKDLIN